MPTIDITYKGRSDGVETVYVPEAEFLILQTLSTEKMTAPQIARKSGSAISLNGIYTLLNRLGKRGLVMREVDSLKVLDVSLKRVFYTRTFNIAE